METATQVDPGRGSQPAVGAVGAVLPVVPAPSVAPVGLPRPRTLLRGALVVALVVVLLVEVLPRTTSVSWSQVVTALEGVPAAELALLALVWAGGLLLHTVTLTAALPGLTHRRALTLSLTGSAVANLLPVGGAAGVALNYHMVRSWGHDRTSFAVYTAVTNVWDVAMKMALPLLVVPAVLVAGTALPGGLLLPLLWVGGTLGSAALLVVVLALVLRRPAVLRRLLARPRGARLVRRVGTVVRDSRTLVRRRWPRLTAGIVAYTAALGLLFFLCCRATGVGLPLAAVVVGFVAERLLSLVSLTPAGLGAVEVVLAGVLVALGGGALPVVAAVLLYRLFTVALEVPVGGVGLLAWLAHRWSRRPVGAA